MNTIDKVILTNIKMREKDMGINISSVVAVCIGVILAYLVSYTDFTWYWLIIVAMHGIERTYEKCFIPAFSVIRLIYIIVFLSELKTM